MVKRIKKHLGGHIRPPPIITKVKSLTSYILPRCFIPSKQKVPAFFWHKHVTDSPADLVSPIPALPMTIAPLALPFMCLIGQVGLVVDREAHGRALAPRPLIATTASASWRVWRATASLRRRSSPSTRTRASPLVEIASAARCQPASANLPPAAPAMPMGMPGGFGGSLGAWPDVRRCESAPVVVAPCSAFFIQVPGPEGIDYRDHDGRSAAGRAATPSTRRTKWSRRLLPPRISSSRIVITPCASDGPCRARSSGGC